MSHLHQVLTCFIFTVAVGWKRLCNIFKGVKYGKQCLVFAYRSLTNCREEIVVVYINVPSDAIYRLIVLKKMVIVVVANRCTLKI